MNKSIVFGLLSTFAVIALVGGVAVASFTSAASNTGNTFGAGSLTLDINGSKPTSTGVFIVTAAKPGDSKVQPLILNNTGTIAANSVVLTSVNVTPTPTTGPNLGSQLHLAIWNDVDNDNLIDNGEVAYNDALLTDASWNSGVTLTGVTLPALTGTKTIKAMVTFDPAASNTYQSTGVSFDLNFQANQ